MATKKTIDPTALGKEQASNIGEMYKTFDDKQREAFLLGRISGMLVLGNAVTDGANEAIAMAESALQEVRQRLYGEEEPKKATPKKKTNVIINKGGKTKKGVKKDE